VRPRARGGVRRGRSKAGPPSAVETSPPALGTYPSAAADRSASTVTHFAGQGACVRIDRANTALAHASPDLGSIDARPPADRATIDKAVVEGATLEKIHRGEKDRRNMFGRNPTAPPPSINNRASRKGARHPMHAPSTARPRHGTSRTPSCIPERATFATPRAPKKTMTKLARDNNRIGSIVYRPHERRRRKKVRPQRYRSRQERCCCFCLDCARSLSLSPVARFTMR
jgi:hypothetical protein